jgi:hypothetical protein
MWFFNRARMYEKGLFLIYGGLCVSKLYVARYCILEYDVLGGMCIEGCNNVGGIYDGYI